MKRVFFLLAPAFLVFFFLSVFFLIFSGFPVWADLETGPVWWDEDWLARVRIEIENQAGVELPSGYTVSVAFDHASLVESGQSLANGDDLRLVYQPEDGDSIELDRILAEGSSWNQAETRVLFQIQAAIPEEGIEENYFLYFNHPQAEAPPADPQKVLAFFEDFEELKLLPFPQYEWCSGDWCRTDQVVFPEVSGEESLSGSKSLKLTGPGSPSAIYITSPIKDYLLGVSFYTTDPATEAGLYFRSWEFSRIYPLFAFFWGSFQLDTGRGLYLENSCRPPDCSFPQPGEWNTLEVKVVGKRIIETRFNGGPIWWFNSPENLELLDDQGDRIGFLYLFPWGQEPTPLYYDDLTLRRAVEKEPVLSLKEAEFRFAPPVPNLVWPEDGALINLEFPAFDWKVGQEEDGFSYQVEVGVSPDFIDEERIAVVVGETSHVFDLAFGEGEYFWRVKTIDENRKSEWSETWRFILDLSPPETRWVEKPAVKSEETWAKFVWSGEDQQPSDDLAFSFRLDTEEGSGFGPQTEIIFYDLAEGEHTFSVRARDEAGNLGDEVSFSWWVDAPLACLPVDCSVAGGEIESQPPLVLEVVSQEKTVVESLEIEDQDEGLVEKASPAPARGEVLGEARVAMAEADALESGKEKGFLFDGEIWLLVLKMAGLSSLLVAVGFFTARLR